MNPRNVTFNGSNLETVITGFQILGLPDEMPERNLNIEYLANTDKRSVQDSRYTSRKIRIEACIKRSGRDLLDESMDLLYKYLSPKEKVLVVPFGSGSRQYTASFKNLSKSNPKGGYVELSLEFECSDSMGYDTSYTTALATIQNTQATVSYGLFFAGTAEWQLPIIEIIFISLTGGTAKTVTVGNSSTGQQISITRTWSNDNVLVIDTQNDTVQVNGADVEFTGALPSFALGAGVIDYTDDLTTRTIATRVYYRKRYL